MVAAATALGFRASGTLGYYVGFSLIRAFGFRGFGFGAYQRAHNGPRMAHEPESLDSKGYRNPYRALNGTHIMEGLFRGTAVFVRYRILVITWEGRQDLLGGPVGGLLGVQGLKFRE